MATEESNITFDEEGVYEQQKQEILDMEHSILFEAVIPPIKTNGDGTEWERIMVAPFMAFRANGSWNLITKAMLITTLQDYVREELDASKDLCDAVAYLRIATIAHESQNLGDFLRNGGNNDTNINS